ncbi:MAG: hypothetical protein H0W72_17575, partial [Planctomycetes bacterium]|nr:hypothetical protein [Planctomycetota bacterium]
TGEALVPPAAGADDAAALARFRHDSDSYVAKQDWVRRARKFAANYFDDDLRRMTHCLKRVHNCKLWEDLRREWKPVDYTRMRETRDETGRVELDPACAGGGCEVAPPGRMRTA